MDIQPRAETDLLARFDGFPPRNDELQTFLVRAIKAIKTGRPESRQSRLSAGQERCRRYQGSACRRPAAMLLAPVRRRMPMTRLRTVAMTPRGRPPTTSPRPILLAVSDNGPQMRVGLRPASPWRCARSRNTSADPVPRPTRPGSRASTATSRSTTHTCSPSATPAPLRAELAVTRAPLQRRPAPPRHRLRHPRQRTPKDEVKPSARPARPASSKPDYTGLPPHRQATTHSTHPGPRRCWLIQRQSASRSQKHVSLYGFEGIASAASAESEVLMLGSWLDVVLRRR